MVCRYDGGDYGMRGSLWVCESGTMTRWASAEVAVAVTHADVICNNHWGGDTRPLLK